MMTVTQNNVYVHSSPPKAISGQGAAIRSWVRSGDLDKLESVILEGQGARLLGLMESSNDVKVRAFLKSVPSYMAKVDLIHDAVTRGSLRETQSLLDKRKLAVARDAVGRGLAHKAVLYGHKSLLDWLGRKFPEVVHLRDNEGRTPLHYTASSHTNSSTPDLYPLLLTLGASPDIPDLHGKKPPYYQAHPEDLDIESPFNNQRSLSRNKTLSRRISPTTPNKYQSNAHIPPPNSVTRAQIRIWIHERDIKKLEQIVWAGQGDKLLLETTNNSKVRRFLDNVPHLLGLIKDVHAACVAGDVGRVKALRDRARGVGEVFMAKDQYGVAGVMKATHLGHRPLLEYFAYEFPKELKSIRDPMGRSVLDYATTPSMASFLTKMLDEVPTNSQELSDLEIRRLRHLPDAPRVVGELGEWDRGGSGGGHEWGKSSIKRKQSSGEEEFGGSPIEDRIPSGRDTSGVGGGGTKYRRAGVTSNGGGGGGGPASLRDDDEKVDIVDVGDQYVVDEELVGEKYELGNVVLEGMDFEVDDDDDDGGRASGRGGNDDELEKELERITGEEQEEELVEKGEVLREEMEAEMAQKEEEQVEAELMESMDQSRITSPMKEPIKTPVADEEVEPEAEEEQITDQTPPPRTPTPRLATPQVPRSPTPVEAKELPPLPDVVTAEDVDQLIQDGNMESLVTLVLDGKGSLLVNRTPDSSMHPEVAEFLTNVPAYMAKIASIHSAANNGNLRDLQSLLDRKRLAQARDERGRVALHMAVLGGHAGVVRYLIGNYQGTDIPDNSGRTPLHYAATLPDHGTMYKILIQSGADPNIKDINDNPPGVYLRRKDLLTREELMDPGKESSKPKTPAEIDTWERPPSPQPDDGGQGDDPPQDEDQAEDELGDASEDTDLDAEIATITTTEKDGTSFPAIWSEEGKYLATVLGDALVKGLTQVSQERPNDPVEYLANFLKTYKNGEILASNIPPEVEERLKSGRAVTPGLLERNGLSGGAGLRGNGGIVEETEAAEDEIRLEEESEKLIKTLDSDNDDELDQINNLDEMDDPEENGGGDGSGQGGGQTGTRDDRGQSVLHFAAARPGGASTILAFLQNPSVNLSWRDEKLRTARDVANGLGRTENVRTIDGWLVSLAIAGDVGSLTSLLLDGYDAFTVEDSSHNHIIDLAEKAGKREVALFLRSIPDFRDKLDKLHGAVRSGDLEMVRTLTLTDRRLAIALGPTGKTALHVAVLFEDFPIVKYLVERFGVGGGGSNRDEVSVLKRGDWLDRTPLHYAMGVEKVEKMTRLLVRNGAKRVVKDLRGRQPSYYFINREEIVALQQEEQQIKQE